MASEKRNGALTYYFDEYCAACPLRALCTTSKLGRSLSVHPQEAMIQEARRYQKTPEGRAKLRTRVIVEHRLARLGQLGMGQARYKGRKKTRFQLMIACTIANLRLAWNHKARTENNSALVVPVLRLISFLLTIYRHLTRPVWATKQFTWKTNLQ
jgi:hypothetical protein